MGSHGRLDFFQLFNGFQGQAQFEPAFGPLQRHPVFMAEFHAVRLPDGGKVPRGNMVGEIPECGFTDGTVSGIVAPCNRSYLSLGP